MSYSSRGPNNIFKDCFHSLYFGLYQYHGPTCFPRGKTRSGLTRPPKKCLTLNPPRIFFTPCRNICRGGTGVSQSKVVWYSRIAQKILRLSPSYREIRVFDAVSYKIILVIFNNRFKKHFAFFSDTYYLICWRHAKVTFFLYLTSKLKYLNCLGKPQQKKLFL